MYVATFVALLLADYDVDIHHILKPPERQKKIKKKNSFNIMSQCKRSR